MRTLATVVVVTLIAAPGCSDGDSVEERRRELAATRHAEAVEAGWDEQARVLADGRVTAAEYDQILTSFVECMEAGGVQMGDPVTDLVNPRIRRVDPVDLAAPAEVLMPCQDRYLVSVQEMLHQDPAPMDPALRDATARCMEERGAPIGDADDLGDMARAIGTDRFSLLAGCITDEAFALYPDLPAVSVAPPSIL